MPHSLSSVVVAASLVELGIWVRPEDRVELVDRLMRERHPAEVELEVLTRSGERRLCSFSAELVEIDGETCAITVVTT